MAPESAAQNVEDVSALNTIWLSGGRITRDSGDSFDEAPRIATGSNDNSVPREHPAPEARREVGPVHEPWERMEEIMSVVGATHLLRCTNH